MIVNEEVLAALSVVILAMIPIVYMLVKHQQAMARIIHERKGSEDEALRREVDQIKQLLVQQTLAIDNLAQQQREFSRPPVPDVVERIQA